MAGREFRRHPEDERAQGRRWLKNWRHIGPLLEQERRTRVACLTDDAAWTESQDLLQAWEPGMLGDAGEELLLQQRVFARATRK